jgi:hypothetical protein
MFSPSQRIVQTNVEWRKEQRATTVPRPMDVEAWGVSPVQDTLEAEFYCVDDVFVGFGLLGFDMSAIPSIVTTYRITPNCWELSLTVVLDVYLRMNRSFWLMLLNKVSHLTSRMGSFWVLLMFKGAFGLWLGFISLLRCLVFQLWSMGSESGLNLRLGSWLFIN